VLRSAQPAVTTDPDSAVIRRSKLSSILEVPLVSKGQVLAVAVLGTTEPDHLFAKEEVDLAFGIATTAAAAIENAELYMQLQARVREIEGLYQADEELHRYLDLEAVLQSLVDVSVDIMGANKSSILAWDEESGILKFQAGRGFKPETIEKMNFTPGEGVIGQVVIDQEPLIVEDTNLADHVSQEITKPEGIRAFIHIPVVIGGTFFGVFNVNFLAPRQFRQEEIRSFTALAQRAALAIENASLYGQSKELAVYEERQRLARDLHDAVTQTLFSASLMAEVLPKIWDRDQAEGIRRLEELRKLNRGALAEMRTLLLELRPTALVEAELDELLQQLSEAISSRAGVEVDLKVEGSCPMPASAKIAIYRLAQEAFNNIAKHAQASHVEVHLNCSPEDGLALRIKDDGKGFDPERIKMGHLGLGIMKERAEEIGGQFNINSEAGGGTEVTFEWQPEPAEEKYYEREYN
jgi:signal transduction histidine kinase